MGDSAHPISYIPKRCEYDASISHKEQSGAFYSYFLWYYEEMSATIGEMSKEVKCSPDQARLVLIFKLGSRRRTSSETKRLRDPNKSESFALECRALFDQGITSYTAIANRLDSNPDAVKFVAVQDGWAKPPTAKKFKWVIPSSLPSCSLTSYTRYCHTIRHFTNKIYGRYKEILDPSSLRGTRWHLDHLLSVYDAYNLGDKPIPWQLIVHPANLHLKQAEDNKAKSSASDLTPAQLLLRIKAFEQEHGKVFLPLIVEQDDSLRNYLYSETSADTVRKRIARDSTVSVKDLKRIRNFGVQKPSRLPREHFRKSHYEWLVYQYLQGATTSWIATELCCNPGLVKSSLKRIGLPSKTELTFPLYEKILKLKKKGLTLTQVARKINKSPLYTLFVFYHFKEQL